MTATPTHNEMLPGFYFIQRGYLNANHFDRRGIIRRQGKDWVTTVKP